MRLFISLMASVTMLFAASAASAYTFSATAQTPGPYAVGDQVVIDVVMSNDGGEAIGAIGGIAFGYDTGVLSFNSGSTVPNAANTGIFLGILPQGGISNAAGAPTATETAAGNGQFVRSLGAGDIIAPGIVEFFSGVQATLPTPVSDDSFDLGINGSLISAGGISASLVFDVIGAGSTTVTIGGDGSNGGVVDGSGASNIQTNATVAVVVPEPGTALLMGLGLAGLGMAGRRD